MNSEKVMTLLRSRGLEGIAEPCLRFRTLPTLADEPTLGSSKLGGNPDLPTEVLWPTWHGKPLDFLVQLDCDEIPPHLKDGLLPETGWLYFFYEIKVNTWGFDPEDRGSGQVLFFDGDRKALVPRPRPGSANATLRSCRLTFFEGIHLNEWSMEDQKSGSDLHDLCQHEDLAGAMAEISGHQILGNTEGVQHSYEQMQRKCQFVSHGIYMGGGSGRAFDEAKARQLEPGVQDWRLLLELGSDENADLLWTDLGILYFWIREEDLRKLDFDRVWVLFECY